MWQSKILPKFTGAKMIFCFRSIICLVSCLSEPHKFPLSLNNYSFATTFLDFQTLFNPQRYKKQIKLFCCQVNLRLVLLKGKKATSKMVTPTQKYRNWIKRHEQNHHTNFLFFPISMTSQLVYITQTLKELLTAIYIWMPSMWSPYSVQFCGGHSTHLSYNTNENGQFPFPVLCCQLCLTMLLHTTAIASPYLKFHTLTLLPVGFPGWISTSSIMRESLLVASLSTFSMPFTILQTSIPFVKMLSKWN